MARTKGSLNKSKTNTIKTISLNRQIENTPIINDETPMDWVSWGKHNNFPMILLDMYANSVTHSACIDFLVNAIIGEGVDYEKMKLDSNEIVPNPYESWDSLLRKCAMDLVIFGGYGIQIIKNNDDATYSYFHQPFSTVRFGKKDNEGEIKTCYLCKDWSQTNKFKPIPIDHLNTTDEISLQRGKAYLLTYVNYNLYDEYYPSVHYASAFDAIRTDIKLKNYDLNSVINNFTPSGALVLNPVEDENERNLIIRNIEGMFSDSANANNIMITFKHSNDDSPIQFVPFESNIDGVNQFADNNLRTTNRIVSAHKIASKTLIGLSLDGNGFASEADILENAFNLTEKLTTNNLRKQLIKTINTLFKLNGIDQQVNLIPLSFNLADLEDKDEEKDNNNADDVEEVEDSENEDTQIGNK